jgi:AraC-like DNA-binding protein
MPRRPPSFLRRFSVLSTRDLGAARATTSRFWPRHTSEVLGPEEYMLDMNRAALGQSAVTFVWCTSRIRVVPTEPVADYSLYVPLEGGVEIVADGRQLAASPGRPLLRGPARACRFEASPTLCLVVDVPAAVIADAAKARGVPPPANVSFDARMADTLVRLVKRLVAAADRSRSLIALQGFSARDRMAKLPTELARLEHGLIDILVGSPPGQRREAAGRCDVGALKDWLASQSHRRVQIGELARRAGVSPRTVERAFLATGCTSREYLQSVRLERARRMLVAPTAGLTVAETAAAAGFTHLGRFATAYRRHFGEFPSQTLARGRASR